MVPLVGTCNTTVTDVQIEETVKAGLDRAMDDLDMKAILVNGK